MKTGPLLITTFQPWRAHQRSNSSDDLVADLHSQKRLPADAIWLRQVPVSFQLAPLRVISEIYRLRPRAVICCGMAEGRAYLSLEQQAKGRRVLQTSVNLSALLMGTTLSEVSDDAGWYVCNHLYYSVLAFIEQLNLETQGLFVHIPTLSPPSKALILNDFERIAARLSQ